MADLLRSCRYWKPTATYLDDPWRCYVDFVEILRGRGARFVTFRDAIDGDVDRESINVILDHHIDDYPLETEIMCRWEREQGARSSVYLFNRSARCPAVEGGGAYGLGDLDLELYRGLEADGFEIGYHQNAVGLAREEAEGHAAGKSLTDDMLARAGQLFADDVEALRRHFTVRSFIPHGAGQGNYLLTDVPESCADLVWTYNNAAASEQGARRPPYANWTDTASRGLHPQVIAGFGAHYVCRHDNLAIRALLAGPGLHHVLVHAGRFAEGMPYEMAGRDYAERRVYRVRDFDEDIDVPFSLRELAGARWGGVERAIDELAAGLGELTEADPRRSYRLLTDCPRVLGAHLLAHDRCLAHFARREAFDREEAGVVRTRQLGTIRPPRPRELPACEDLPASAALAFGDDGPDESCRPFFNDVYAKRLFTHLRDAPIAFDVLVLRRWSIDEPRELEALAGVLGRYASTGAEINLRCRVALGADACASWLRSTAMRGVLGSFQVSADAASDREGSGATIIDIQRGRMGVVQRVRHALGF